MEDQDVTGPAWGESGPGATPSVATAAASLPARVGIVGAGNISDHYLRIAAGFASFEVRAVADIDPERARAKAEAHGVQAVSVPDLLADDDIDVVVNLTVPAAHAAVSRAVLEAGKHVYSEKPLSTDRVAAAVLLTLAAERGLRVGCAPDTFLGAGLQTARAVVDSGLIGEPVAATAFMMSSGPERWHPDPGFFFAPGAGPLFDMGPYYLTALVNLFGAVARVSGSAKVGRVSRPILSAPLRGTSVEVTTPTHVTSLLEFAGGPVATLVTSFDAPASQLPWCEVYGTEAALSLPDPNTFGGPLKVRRASDREWQELPITRPYDVNSRGLGLADMVVAAAERRAHRASGELAYHVLDVMQSVLDAAGEHAWLELQSRVARPAALPEDVRF
ncbi:MAG TPA: Gfo/Idh/MocA family oxidoreductase [Trueperaceae bacterium]